MTAQPWGPQENEILSFPGFSGTLPSKQYGGYISIPGTEKQLFYMLVLSQGNPKLDPLVLWYANNASTLRLISTKFPVVEAHLPCAAGTSMSASIKSIFQRADVACAGSMGAQVRQGEEA